MRTEQLVRTTATVVRIVELEPGNVYKRLVKEAYQEKHEIKLGVVESVLNNGEKTAITALEFNTTYSTIKPEIKVFSDDSDLQIFPATTAEVETYFQDLRESAARQTRTAEQALLDAQRVQKAVTDATQHALSAPAVEYDVTEIEPS